MATLKMDSKDIGDEIKGFGDHRGGKDYYVGPFYLTNTSLVNPLFETT